MAKWFLKYVESVNSKKQVRFSVECLYQIGDEFLGMFFTRGDTEVVKNKEEILCNGSYLE